MAGKKKTRYTRAAALALGMALMAAPALAATTRVVDGAESDIVANTGEDIAITGTNSANIPNLNVEGGKATVDGELTVNNETKINSSGTLTVLGTMDVKGAVTLTDGELIVERGAALETVYLSANGGYMDIHAATVTASESVSLTDGELYVEDTGILETKNLTATDSSVGIIGTLTASGTVSLTEGNLYVAENATLETKNLTVTDSSVGIIGTLTASDTVSLTDSDLHSFDGSALKTANLIMDGNTVWYIFGGLATVSDASTLRGGELFVADGGSFIFGTDTEWAQTAMNTMAPGSSAAVTLGLYKPLTLSGTKLIVDDLYDSTYDDSTFYIADNSAIVLNVGNLGGSPALMAPDGSVFKAENDISIYLANTPGGDSYTLLSGFTGGMFISGVPVDNETYTYASKEEAEDAGLYIDNVLLHIDSSVIAGGKLSVVIGADSLLTLGSELGRYTTMVDSLMGSGTTGTTAASDFVNALFSREFTGTGADRAALIESAASFGSIASGPALSGMKQAEKALAAHFDEKPDPLKRSSVWATPYYSRSDVSGMSAGSFLRGGWESKNYGVVVGWDKHHERGRAGIALHVGKSDIDGSDVFSHASGDGKYFGGMLYADWDFGAWQLTGDISLGKNKADLNTRSAVGALTADGVDATTFSVGTRALYTLKKTDHFALRPFAGVRFTRYSQDAYDIWGGNSTLFHVDSADMNLWNFSLGLKFDWFNYTTQNGWSLKPTAELSYIRAAGDTDLEQNVRFAGVGTRGSNLGIQIADDDAFSVGLGVTGAKNNFSVGLGVNGLFSENETDYSLNATFRWEL